MDIDELIPIAEYAKKVGKSALTIADKCRRGTLPGARKLGRDWFVPRNAPYEDNRIISGRYINWRKPKK